MLGRLVIEAQPGTPLRVRNQDGSPAVLRLDPFSDIVLPSNVLDVPETGIAVAYCAGEFVLDNPNTNKVYRQRHLVAPEQWLDLTHPLFGGRASSGALVDCSAAANKMFEAAEAGHGVPWVPIGTFGLANPMKMGCGASLHGAHMTLTVFKAMQSLKGMGLWHLPTRGSLTNGPKSHILRCFFDGDNVGITKDVISVTTGSNIATCSTPTVLATRKVGDLVSIWGVPEPSYLFQKLTANTFVIGYEGAPLDGNLVTTNTGVVDKRDAIWRDAWQLSATAVDGERVLQIASGDWDKLSQLGVGQRASGARIDENDDGDGGIGRNGLIVSIDEAAHTITLDRKAKSSGTFTLTVWTQSWGLRVQDAASAEFFSPQGYDPAKIYEGPKVDDCLFRNWGGGVDIGTARVRSHLRGGRTTENWGEGLKFRSASDSLGNRWGSGVNWNTNVLFIAMPTVRYDGEVFLVKRNDINSDGRFQACREAQLTGASSDVNGSWYFQAKNGFTNSQLKASHVFFKYFNNNRKADGTGDAFITVNGNAHVSIENCGFEADRDEPYARPPFIARALGGGSAHISGSAMPMDPSDINCPFSQSVGNNTSVSYEIRDTLTGRFVRAGVTQLDPASGVLARQDGTNVPDGLVGSRVQANNGPGTAVALADGASATIRSIQLPPGNHMVWGTCRFVADAGTVGTKLEASLNLVDASQVKSAAEGYDVNPFGFSGVTGELWVGRLGPLEVKVSAADVSKTVNLNAQAAFSSGGVKAVVTLYARSMAG